VTDEVDCFFGSARSEHFAPGLLPNSGELEFGVRRVHAVDLFFRWCSKYFNDFNELVYARLTGEQRLTHEELCDDAADGPHVDCRCVVCGAKDQLWGTVVPRANV